jgi:hypothetical protein
LFAVLQGYTHRASKYISNVSFTLIELIGTQAIIGLRISSFAGKISDTSGREGIGIYLVGCITIEIFDP